VTQTPERIESGFRWWLSNPNLIVFTSQKTEEQGPSAGLLSTVKVDGSDYQVLETESSIAPPAPGPDGMTIAYDRAGLPYLWVMGKGAQPVDLTGLPKPIRTAIAPAWSPDGLKLAWKVWGQDGNWSAVAVQDLTTQKWTLLHEYQPQGGTELFADLAWSTNGKWIATVNQGEASASKGSLPLWVLPTTGGEEHYIGNGASPVWSPDSSALVFYYQPSQSNTAEESRLTRVQLDTWQLDQPDLPAGAQPREWHGTGDDFH
jgi:Tol biopolymer transport system component